MGSSDGAEIFELVGIYILCHLTKFIGKKDVELYIDDGLIILRQLNGQQTDRIRKQTESENVSQKHSNLLALK